MNFRVLLASFIILTSVLSCSDRSDNLNVKEPKTEEPADNYETWTGLQIVMFTPSDVELPADYKERMKELADYTEYFFKKWMNHWDYNCENPMKIRRSADGYPIIWRIKGKYLQSSGKYNELGYAKSEVIPRAIEKYGMAEKNQTWWILSYPGPSSKAFRGGGDFRGGTASANFIPNTGSIIYPGDDNLASGAAVDFKMKALIHELTHALGLGHTGPQQRDNLGNSLMGSTINAYHKVYPDEDRVYLTQASAAMLWKHPLFDGNFDRVSTIPSIQMTEFQSIYDENEDVLNISGRLISNCSAHSVVIANDINGDKSDYWRKTYVGDVADDGSFTCQIADLNEKSGELIICFCFDNGAISGVTGKIGLSRGLKKSYTYNNGTYLFNK